MKTKKLTFIIKCCKDCPNLCYEEYDDVGTSFGLDYYCQLMSRDIYMTLEEAKKHIHKECPLP